MILCQKLTKNEIKLGLKLRTLTQNQINLYLKASQNHRTVENSNETYSKIGWFWMLKSFESA